MLILEDVAECNLQVNLIRAYTPSNVGKEYIRLIWIER